MQVKHTAADLIAFEDEIAEAFANKLVRGPIHLSGGNESQLIDIFDRHVNPEDWLLCSWRSHYACLLKGVPPDELKQAILAGKSISLCFPSHRILSSGIVGGTAPIAVGLAMGIKRKGEHPTEMTQYGDHWRPKDGRKVVCFLGDTTAETGIVHESIKYAVNFDLPVLFVIEDNGLSVSTETASVWGMGTYPATTHQTWLETHDISKVIRYRYKLTRPHVGIGTFVEF